MAQWAGQYTGRTHESKIRDLEKALLTAIQALRAADEEHFIEKQKSAVRLCERLLSARIKAIRARISKLSETRSLENDPKKTQNLIRREKELSDSGVGGIFVEFEIQNIATGRGNDFP